MIIFMNKKMIIVWIIILPLIFSLGLFSGHYKTFPFDFLKELKSSLLLSNDDFIDDSFEIYENDIDSLIDISTKDEISNTRSEIINYIWKQDPPTNLIPQISLNIFDQNYEDLKNLQQIDEFTITMDYDVKSISYLFVAENSNNKLIIYHQGHAGDFLNGKKSIQFFLENGYSVLAFSMPLLGMNNQPIVDTSFGKVKLISHEHLKFLNSKNFSSIKFFVEPIFISLNYLDEQYDFESYIFVGFSGGGWTAILYSAIDDRISQTYSIAGSVPINFRSIQKNLGDYEQTLPELYSIANYLELYIMSSYGENRKLTQIFNKYDPCCFSGENSKIYENVIKEKLVNLEGNFEIFIDDTHKKHKISEVTLNLINNSIF